MTHSFARADRRETARPLDDATHSMCRELARSIAQGLAFDDVVVWLRDLDSGAYVAHARAAASGDAPRELPRRLVTSVDGGTLRVPIVHGGRALGVISGSARDDDPRDALRRAAVALAADLVAPRFAALLGVDAWRVAANGDARVQQPPAPVALAPRGGAARPVLRREAFAAAVAAALRHLHDACRLAKSPLRGSALVATAAAAGDDEVCALRAVLLDAIDALAQSPATQAHARVLRRRFVEPCASQALLAEALHRGASTLRRHVHAATALLVAELWRREWRACRAQDGHEVDAE